MAILEPRHAHLCTILALHGFTSNASDFKEKLRDAIPTWWRNHAKIVFLNAPMRRISCYNNQWMRSWHDYYTNYGDLHEGLEEEIDADDLNRVRHWIGSIINSLDQPAVILGESQGACVAIDVGYAYNAPVISLYGQRYRHTPKQGHVNTSALVGTKDDVIPPKLTMQSLRDTNASIVTANNFHAEMNTETKAFLKNALGRLRAYCVAAAADNSKATS